jgi:hypothetical protein
MLGNNNFATSGVKHSPVGKPETLRKYGVLTGLVTGSLAGVTKICVSLLNETFLFLA